MTDDDRQVSPADSYTYKTGLTWKDWIPPVFLIAIIGINGYLAMGVCGLRYVEILLPVIGMIVLFGGLHFYLKTETRFSREGITVLRRRELRSWRWDEVGQAQSKVNGVLLLHRDYRKPDRWTFKVRTGHILTVPLDEIRKVIGFFPDSVAIDAKIRQFLAQQSFPLKWLTVYTALLLIHIACWWTAIMVFADPTTDWEALIGIVTAFIFIPQVSFLIALHLRRYGKNLLNPVISVFEMSMQVAFGGNLVLIVLGNKSPAYLLFLFLLLYFGLCIAVWRLLAVLSLRFHPLVPWTAFALMALIFQYPGQELRWEAEHMRVYPVGPPALLRNDDTLITSMEKQTERLTERKDLVFCVVWPDGRKALCFSQSSWVSGQSDPGEIYYYSPDMDLICRNEFPGVGLIARNSGDILCWLGGAGATQGLYMQEFGSQECRFIPGQCMPVPFVPDGSEAQTVYFAKFEKDHPAKLMKYNWRDKTSTEILQDDHLDDVSFVNAEKCGYITRDDQFYAVMMWEKEAGISEILRKAVPEGFQASNQMQLSPFLAHAAWFNKTANCLEIIDLHSRATVSIPADRGGRNCVTWSRRHLSVYGEIYQIAPDGLIQKMPINLPADAWIYFSLDESLAAAYTGNMIISNTIMINLKSGNIKYLLSNRNASGDNFCPIYSTNRWDAAGFNHLPFSLFMNKMELVHIDAQAFDL